MGNRIKFAQFFFVVTMICVLPDAAADGRIELNQTVIDEAGGFPYIISAPGNFVLTGDLSVPADTDGIVINTTRVRIDFNGFTLRGTFNCSNTSCGAGDSAGIARGFSVGFGHFVQVTNGMVEGFSQDCISVGGSSSVTNMAVSDCGRYGIVSSGGVVTGNVISDTGDAGLRALNAAYANNAVVSAGLSGSGASAFETGSAAGGNYCADGSCSRNGKRMFYLNQTSVNGSLALNTCASGYHMASWWEILDPSGLQYDTSRGYLVEDSGNGPPTSLYGWVRTGKGSGGSVDPGGSSCNGYTSTSGLGTNVALNRSWNWDLNTATSELVAPWWNGRTDSCSTSQRVWCVQD